MGWKRDLRGILVLVTLKSHLHCLAQFSSLKPEQHQGALRGSASLMAFRGNLYEMVLLKCKIRFNLSENFLFFPSPTRE